MHLRFKVAIYTVCNILYLLQFVIVEIKWSTFQSKRKAISSVLYMIKKVYFLLNYVIIIPVCQKAVLFLKKQKKDLKQSYQTALHRQLYSPYCHILDHVSRCCSTNEPYAHESLDHNKNT